MSLNHIKWVRIEGDMAEIHILANVSVRYPTCLRTEFDSNANTISAQHPNSDTRIKIAHGFTDNLRITSPYEPRPSRPTGFPFLSIFSPYSRRDPRWFPGYDLLFWPFSDYHEDYISTISIFSGPLSPLCCDTSYPWILATSRYKNYFVP